MKSPWAKGLAMLVLTVVPVPLAAGPEADGAREILIDAAASLREPLEELVPT